MWHAAAMSSFLTGLKMATSDTMRAAEEVGLSAAEDRCDGPRRTAPRTVTRVDLAEAVYRCVGLSRNESGILVQSVLEELCFDWGRVRQIVFIWPVFRALQIGANWAKSQDWNRGPDNRALRHGF